MYNFVLKGYPEVIYYFHAIFIYSSVQYVTTYLCTRISETLGKYADHFHHDFVQMGTTRCSHLFALVP